MTRTTFDQPREGDSPNTGGTWQAIQTTQLNHQPVTTVVSEPHATQDDAVEALVKHFEDKIRQTDWAPTRGGWQRGIRDLRRNKTAKVFSVTYGTRPTPTRSA